MVKDARSGGGGAVKRRNFISGLLALVPSWMLGKATGNRQQATNIRQNFDALQKAGCRPLLPISEQRLRSMAYHNTDEYFDPCGYWTLVRANVLLWPQEPHFNYVEHYCVLSPQGCLVTHSENLNDLLSMFEPGEEWPPYLHAYESELRQFLARNISYAIEVQIEHEKLHGAWPLGANYKFLFGDSECKGGYAAYFPKPK